MINFFIFLLFVAILNLIWITLSFAPLFLLIIVGFMVMFYFVNEGIKLNIHFKNYNLSPFNTFSIIFLLISLIVLSERALYDIARIFTGPNFDYFDNLNTILAQAMFIIPVFIFSIILNMLIGEKLKKYAVVVIPYLITSVVLIAQLSIQIVNYFYNHHTNWQLYLVMATLALISSVSIFVIQNKILTVPSEKAL